MKTKIINQYIILSILTKILGMSIIGATYMNYLLANGLDYFQANLVNVAFYITLFIFEIPTGTFADTFGRKASYIVSCWSLSISGLIYGLSRDFWGFALAECIAAIGQTFATGAFQAWLVDSLKHHGHEVDLKKIFAKVSFLGGGATIASAFLGSYFAEINISLPWFIMSVGMAIVAIYAQIIMKEEYFVKRKLSFVSGFNAMKATAKTSIEYGLKNKNIRFVLTLGLVQFFSFMALNMFWQPYFGQMIGQGTKIGLFYTIMQLSIMLGARYLVHKKIEKSHEKKYLIYIDIVIGFAVILSASFSNFPIAAIFFLIHEVARGMWQPMKDAYLHDQIPSKERATVLSFESIAHHVGGAFGLLASGLVAKHFGISASWIMSGMVLIVGTMLVARNGQQASSKHKA